MSLILQFYIFCCIFCFLSSLNACYILHGLAKDMNYEFETTSIGSILRLFFMSLIPFYNIFAAFVWLCTPVEVYEEKVMEFAEPIEK